MFASAAAATGMPRSRGDTAGTGLTYCNQRCIMRRMSTTYLSADDVAAALGIARSTVHRLRKTHGIGVEILGRPAFTAKDLEKLRPLVRGRGCPKFVPGNDLWKRRKKAKKVSRKGQ